MGRGRGQVPHAGVPEIVTCPRPLPTDCGLQKLGLDCWYTSASSLKMPLQAFAKASASQRKPARPKFTKPTRVARLGCGGWRFLVPQHESAAVPKLRNHLRRKTFTNANTRDKTQTKRRLHKMEVCEICITACTSLLMAQMLPKQVRHFMPRLKRWRFFSVNAYLHHDL